MFRRQAILSNPDVIGHTPVGALFENDFWGTALSDPGSHGSYRPLCVASYRLNYLFSGFNPWSYHLVNILLHVTATVLVVVVARRLLPTYCMKVGTAVAGLSFAAHPVHTEAVAGVVGRADLAACNFFLLSFLVYTKHMRLRDERQHHLLKTGLLQTRSKSRISKWFQTTFQFAMKFFKIIRSKKPKNHKIPNGLKKGPAKVNVVSKADSVCVGVDRSELYQWVTLLSTIILATAGTLCKEPAIMILPLCIFYDFIKGIRQEAFYAPVSTSSYYFCLFPFVLL